MISGWLGAAAALTLVIPPNAVQKILPFGKVGFVDRFLRAGISIKSKGYPAKKGFAEHRSVDRATEYKDKPVIGVKLTLPKMIGLILDYKLISWESVSRERYRPFNLSIAYDYPRVEDVHRSSSSVYNLGSKREPILGKFYDRHRQTAFAVFEQPNAFARHAGSSSSGPSRDSGSEQGQNDRSERPLSPDEVLCSKAIGSPCDLDGVSSGGSSLPLRPEIRYLSILGPLTCLLVILGAWQLPNRTRRTTLVGLGLIGGGLACYGAMLSL